jgi:hypothetical protein
VGAAGTAGAGGAGGAGNAGAGNAGVAGGRVRVPRAGTQLSVLIDWQTLRDGLHAHSTCQTAWGTPLAPATVRRLACDADIIPIVFNGPAEIADWGRAKRLATDAQRRAVIARDRHCALCDLPPAWCQIHHLTDWTKGGPTNLADLALLCPRHHTLVHESGHTLRRHPDGTYHLHPPNPARGP